MTCRIAKDPNFVPWCSRQESVGEDGRGKPLKGTSRMAPSGELAPQDEPRDDGESSREPCSRCGRKVAGIVCRLGKCSYLRHLATAPERQLTDIKRRVNGRYGR